MQIIFHVDNIEEYLHKGKDFNFPDPPDRCPYPACKCRVKLKRHGFYYRYYLDGLNCVKIARRRYICPVCKRTLSYLPDFCIPHFQYSFNMVVKSLKETLLKEKTLSSFISDLKRNFTTILFSRQHIYFYTKRIMNNLSFIIYGLRQIDPYIKLSETDSQRERAREILDIKACTTLLPTVLCSLPKIISGLSHIILALNLKNLNKNFDFFLAT